jgi:hypothetical protein
LSPALLGGRQHDRDQVFATDLAAKRQEILPELVPTATLVAVLVNPANPTSMETTLRDVEDGQQRTTAMLSGRKPY